MKSLVNQNTIHPKVTTLNEQFNAMTKRFAKCKPLVLHELTRSDLKQRNLFLTTLEQEAQQVKITLTVFLQSNPSKFTEFVAVAMWNLVNHVSNFKDVLAVKTFLKEDVTDTVLIAEKKTIVDFLIFLKVIDVLQPSELKGLNITSVLEREEYRQLVELIQ